MGVTFAGRQPANVTWTDESGSRVTFADAVRRSQTRWLADQPGLDEGRAKEMPVWQFDSQSAKRPLIRRAD